MAAMIGNVSRRGHHVHGPRRTCIFASGYLHHHTSTMFFCCFVRNFKWVITGEKGGRHGLTAQHEKHREYE